MQRLCDIEFVLRCFKHFSFKHKNKEIHRIYYKDAIYEGQGNFEEGEFVKNGIGMFITCKGEVFYGRFNNNNIEGEGNFIFTNGTFLRGSFRRDKLHGKCLITQANGDLFILTFKDGFLNGHCTYFPVDQFYAYVISFKQNKFEKVIKKFYFSAQKYESAKLAILKSIFENSQLNETLYTDTDVQKVLSKLGQNDKIHISNMLIDNAFLYCGLFDSELSFNGLGILIDFGNGKIKVGDWEDGKQTNFGFVIDNKFLFQGNYKEGNLSGKVVVKNLETKEYKECIYIDGSLSEIVKEGYGELETVFFKFNSVDEVETRGYRTDSSDYMPMFFGCNILEAIGFDSLRFDMSIQELEQSGKEEDGILFEAQKDTPVEYKQTNYFGDLPDNIDKKPIAKRTSNPKSLNSTTKKIIAKLSRTLTPQKMKKIDFQPKFKETKHKDKCWDFEENYSKRKEYIRTHYYVDKWSN